MSALSLLYTRRRMSALPKAQEREPLPARAAPRDWVQIMRFCEESGVTPAKWLVLGPEDRAAKACTGMKYPLVVKVLPSESEHKTELGLVKLRVRSARGSRRPRGRVSPATRKAGDGRAGAGDGR